MASALYDRMIAFNYGDDERLAIMREVWDPTPWMVDASTGSFYHNGLDHEMQEWCYAEFGPQSFPLHGKSGRWIRGCATVHGWTWFGFADKADMERFIARWPAPEGVEQPA
jgi:hypothetical protein